MRKWLGCLFFPLAAQAAGGAWQASSMGYLSNRGVADVFNPLRLLKRFPG
jgi:flagellar protein FlhE